MRCQGSPRSSKQLPGREDTCCEHCSRTSGHADVVENCVKWCAKVNMHSTPYCTHKVHVAVSLIHHFCHIRVDKAFLLLSCIFLCSHNVHLALQQDLHAARTSTLSVLRVRLRCNRCRTYSFCHCAHAAAACPDALMHAGLVCEPVDS